MENTSALVVISQVLYEILEKYFKEKNVKIRLTNRPPDRARNGIESNQVNLFLLQAAPIPMMKSVPESPIGKTSEVGDLEQNPYCLYYLVSVYASNEGRSLTQFNNEYLLNSVILAFQEHSIITDEIIPSEIRGGFSELRNNQTNRITILPHPLNYSEMLSLWQGFRTPYHSSILYSVSPIIL